MSKKIIIITSIIGLLIGIFFALQSRSTSHEDHMDVSADHEQQLPFDNNSHETKGSPTHNMSMSSDYTSRLTHYFSLQDALAKDNLENAKLASKKLVSSLDADSDITPAAKQIQASTTIQDARSQFKNISQAMEALVYQYGTPQGMTIVKYHCPMANHNKGASWLQNHEGTLNPYFGSEMLTCGSKIGPLK